MLYKLVAGVVTAAPPGLAVTVYEETVGPLGAVQYTFAVETDALYAKRMLGAPGTVVIFNVAGTES